MGEDYGDWGWTFSALMNEMNSNTIGNISAMMKRREFLHLHLPVELVSPIGANLLEKPKIEPILPAGIGDRVRPTGSVQASAKIVDRLLRERDRKRFQRHRSLGKWFQAITRLYMTGDTYSFIAFTSPPG
jgi:hypothetical protein